MSLKMNLNATFETCLAWGGAHTKKKNYGLWRRLEWIECMFIKHPWWCPKDSGRPHYDPTKDGSSLQWATPTGKENCFLLHLVTTFHELQKTLRSIVLFQIRIVSYETCTSLFLRHLRICILNWGGLRWMKTWCVSMVAFKCIYIMYIINIC